MLRFYGFCLGALALLPMGYLFYRGLGAPQEWGLLLESGLYFDLVKSVGMALTVTLFASVLAFILAFLTVKTDLPGRRFWTIAAILPLSVPSYIGSFALISALGPKGSLLANILGRDLPSIYGWPGTVLALTLFTYPYIFLSLQGSLKSLNPALEEAGLSLGLSRLQVFYRVDLPHIRSAFVGGMLIVFLYAMSDFGTPALMRFDSFARLIYTQYQSHLDRDMAALYALVLGGVIWFILSLKVFFGSSSLEGSSGRLSYRSKRNIPLGKWAYPAVGFCALLFCASFLLPISVMVYWVKSWYVVKIFPSLCLAIGATAVILLLVLPLAIAPLYGQRSVFLRRVLSLFYLGQGLPGIVVALSFVFFVVRYLNPFYQTFAVLVLAYLVLFGAKANDILRTGCAQVSSRLKDAAYSLGRSPVLTFVMVLSPLLRPVYIAAGLMLMLSILKELPCTLLLAPIGFQSLAMQVWTAAEEGLYAEVAVPALTLCSLTFILLCGLVWLEKRQGRGWRLP